MAWQSQIRTLLKSELSKGAVVAEPRPTLRILAGKLGVSAATLSRFLSSEEDIAQESALKILNKLRLTGEERNYYRGLMGAPLEREEKDLPLDGRILIEHWLHTAVWVSLDLPEAMRSPESLAGRLGVSRERVDEVLALLVEKGFAERSGQGVHVKSNQHFRIGNAGGDDLVRNFHAQSLEVSRAALEKIPTENRQFSTITFSGNNAMMERARSEILETVRKISTMMDTTPEKTEIYRFSVSLFPLNFEGK